MLSWFVGNVDVPAAAVLVAMVIGAGIAFASFIAVYSSKQEVSNKFELAKMAQQAETTVKLAYAKNEHETSLAKIASSREIEIRRIDSGMIDLKAQQSRHPEEG